MSTVDQALATQLANIEKRTGKTLAALVQIVKTSGLAKHGEIRNMLKDRLELGHGDANTLTHYAMKTSSAFEAPATADDPLAAIYIGAKERLRPIHEKLLTAIAKFGEFEIAPKKGYVSLRRKKQFATIGPATNSRVDVGLNMKGETATDRLAAEPPKGMCQYKVRVTASAEVDAELLAWIRTAYDAAG